jgi:hypothetical protein
VKRKIEIAILKIRIIHCKVMMKILDVIKAIAEKGMEVTKRWMQ